MSAAPTDNAVLALQAFLSVMRAPVTHLTIEQTLSRHPHYPSMLAISDSLNAWKIDHVTTRVRPEQLVDIPTPFFTQLNVEGGQFTVVRAVSADGVRWWHSQNGWQKDSLAEFLRMWTPVILLAELSDQSGERNYRANQRREQLARWKAPLLWTGALFCLVLTAWLVVGRATGPVAWSWLVLLLTKLTGTGICITLLERQLNPSNSDTGLCRFHQAVDCNAVLTSPAATVGGKVSWSELGFFYFAGGFLALAIGLDNALVKSVLWALGWLALPYTLFSVYYQARVVGKWCSLCLMVQVLILTEVAVSFTYIPLWAWNWSGAAVLGLAFTLPIISWVLFRPVRADALQKSGLTAQLNRFRNDPGIFAFLLQQQEQMPPLPPALRPLTIGNPRADCSLTLVINPYCQPCAQAFTDAEALVSAHESINCRILFAIGPDTTDARATFVEHLLNLPADESINALRTWLSRPKKNAANGSRTFPACRGESDALTQLDAHSRWTTAAGITTTPTVYVDGYKLPAPYQLSDVPYLIKYGWLKRPSPKHVTPMAQPAAVS